MAHPIDVNSASIKSGAPKDCPIVGHAMHRHPNAGERWVEYEGYGDQIMDEGEFPKYDEGDCYDIFFSEQTQRTFSSLLDRLDKLEKRVQMFEGS